MGMEYAKPCGMPAFSTPITSSVFSTLASIGVFVRYSVFGIGDDSAFKVLTAGLGGHISV